MNDKIGQPQAESRQSHAAEEHHNGRVVIARRFEQDLFDLGWFRVDNSDNRVGVDHSGNNRRRVRGRYDLHEWDGHINDRIVAANETFVNVSGEESIGEREWRAGQPDGNEAHEQEAELVARAEETNIGQIDFSSSIKKWLI